MLWRLVGAPSHYVAVVSVRFSLKVKLKLKSFINQLLVYVIFFLNLHSVTTQWASHFKGFWNWMHKTFQILCTSMQHMWKIETILQWCKSSCQRQLPLFCEHLSLPFVRAYCTVWASYFNTITLFFFIKGAAVLYLQPDTIPSPSIIPQSLTERTNAYFSSSFI